MDLAELLPWIIVAAVVVVLAVVVLLVLRRRKRQERTDRLRSRFGPEYDRAVDRADSRSEAEDELEQRQERHDRLRLRPLEAEERRSFLVRWEDLQASFVDGPASAVRGADVLLDDVALARGYPDAIAEQRLNDLAVDHSDEVHAYRQAADGRDGMEDDRRSLLASRGLFEVLLGPESEDDDAPDAPFDERLTMGGREPGSAEPRTSEPAAADAPFERVLDDDPDAAGSRQDRLTDEGPRSEQQPAAPPPRSEP